MKYVFLVSLTVVFACSSEIAPSAVHGGGPGEALFKQRCALCHTPTVQNGQGPGLAGVVGRKAGSAPGFIYTKSIRDSGLVWDRSTLDKFLAAPTQVVRGTMMVVATPATAEREQLIAYLASLGETAVASDAAPAVGATPAAGGDGGPFGSVSDSVPGKRWHIGVGDLPAPTVGDMIANPPRLSGRSADTKPLAPKGFRVDLVTAELDHPRLLRTAPNGDVFVAETARGRLSMLRDVDGNPSVSVFAEGLDAPFGMAFVPAGSAPKWLYVASNNAVVRFAYEAGDLKARGRAETVVPVLSSTTGGHTTRDIVFAPDGKNFYVSVGSQSNAGEGGMQREEHRADILLFDEDGKPRGDFASGIRNCVSMTLQPATGALWCSVNERDGLGENLVPDYVTRVRVDGFYGWPWFYLGSHEDPRRKGERPELASKVIVPDVLVQAHSAALGMTFYTGTSFPADDRGSAFVALHGSWNRARRTGYKVIRLLMDASGVPTGDYEDFLTGFASDDTHVWGRPVGVAVSKGGALIVSEDGASTLWRVRWEG